LSLFSLAYFVKKSQLLAVIFLKQLSCCVGRVPEGSERERERGIDPEAYADSAAKYDPEAGWEARSEAGSGSELRQSDSFRALKSYSVRRNRARYGIAERCGELG